MKSISILVIARIIFGVENTVQNYQCVDYIRSGILKLVLFLNGCIFNGVAYRPTLLTILDYYWHT